MSRGMQPVARDMLGANTNKIRRIEALNEIWHYIGVHWVEWLFAAVSALCCMGYRQMLKRQIEENRKSAALQDGMQALLRDRIIQAYNHYQDKRYCPIYGKENAQRMYDAYHALGGNDVATELKDKLLKMPEEPAEGEE